MSWFDLTSALALGLPVHHFAIQVNKQEDRRHSALQQEPYSKISDMIVLLGKCSRQGNDL